LPTRHVISFDIKLLLNFLLNLYNTESLLNILASAQQLKFVKLPKVDSSLMINENPLLEHKDMHLNNFASVYINTESFMKKEWD
jgi:hypothetical protein